jgi:hypothetical protein
VRATTPPVLQAAVAELGAGLAEGTGASRVSLQHQRKPIGAAAAARTHHLEQETHAEPCHTHTHTEETDRESVCV